MKFLRFRRVLRASLLLLLPFSLLTSLQAQGAKAKEVATPSRDADADHEKERSDWFLRGRVVAGKSSAELRRRAYQAKMQARTARVSRTSTAALGSQSPSSPGGWVPLGPVPLASDASGDGFQNYNQVSGRATAVAIDPADASGSTIYIGGAQGGVWKSVNAANSIANNVAWTAITDDQATLSIGSIAIQPGNSNPANSVILAGTGEADNSADSYFGLGILRSADGGNTWSLIRTANGGALGPLSFSGLGAARMAFSTAASQTSTVVAAMASTSEGVTDGALTGNTFPGLYTSTDAGQTWTYDALFSGASEATSATSVVHNASAGLFFAALRYHGFYSSPDGLTWTPLASQPGASGLLSTAACPQNFSSTCPIYRGEITVVPGRNEMYVWFVSLDANGNELDQGIWQSLNSGATWTPINDSGIINCGDFNGCGVEQGSYNLELLAIPNGTQATDLYAGAINLYKCSITSINPRCGITAFVNLTHAYGCSPLAALAHVHPDQHALAYTIPTASDALMYFANDGGIYRALNGFTGLSTGSCSGTNLFDDLNQNLGSMTQFVSFSQDLTDANTLLGGTQDNGSPATAAATASSSWGNVLSGDGGYNAIDPNSGAWFASNPDTGSGTLNIQECFSGTSCNDSLFNSVISSSNLGGDDGAFYFPYILDPQSPTNLLVGTCRVWSGPRSGGAFTLLSLNFDTLGTGTCAGTEVNVVRSLAIAHNGTSGAQVIYATTDGPGPNATTFPVGGNVWATTNATAVSGTTSAFANVTLNGPGGASINPNQFPISGVAIDTSDPSGNTAYVTVMGFTGGLGPGHVWQTTNAGASWIDFTAAGTSSPLPDSPVNAVVVDPAAHMVYVGTDVGVFGSSTSSAGWTEVGAIAGPNEAGFLPNVAVTALAIFNSPGQKLLRASTYGRGVWQFNLLAPPDFQIAVSNTPLTVVLGSTATFNGTITALNGYNNSVELSCVGSLLPSPCTPIPLSLTPTSLGSAFLVTAGTSTVGDYSFNVQGAGSDPNNTTHVVPVTLNVVNVALVSPLPLVTDPRGTTSAPVNFQVQLMAQGSFNESATLSCSFPSIVSGAKCAFTPSATVALTSASPARLTVAVTVPASTPPNNYPVTLQATIQGVVVPLIPPFTLKVALNPNFTLGLGDGFPNIKAGSAGATEPVTITPSDGFAGPVTLSCTTSPGPSSCDTNTAPLSAPYAQAAVTIIGTDLSAGSYQVSVQGTSGSLTNSLPIPVPFNVGDYSIGGPAVFTTVPGGTAALSLTFTSENSYSGQIGFTCDHSPLAGSGCVFSPASPVVVGTGAVVPVTATVTVPSSATAGSYAIKISTQDASGEPNHNRTATLTIQDFALGSVTPSTQSVGSGETATYSLSVNPVGASFANPVILSCSGAPANSTCRFAPNPVTPGNGPTPVTMTIATGATTPQGNNSISVTGTSGSTLSHATTASLTVANTLLLKSVHPFPSAADAGTQQTAKVSLTPNYSGSVTATCNASGLPAEQCTISPVSPIAVNGSPVTLTAILNIPNSAVPGAYSVHILVADAASGTPSTSLALPLNVAQDYTIENLSPTTQTIAAGQSITYNLAVAPVGTAYSNTVALSCTGAPLFNGTCALSPSSVGPLSNSTSAAVVMTVTTQAIAAQAWFPGEKAGPWMCGMCLPFAAVLLWGTVRRRRHSLVLPLGVAFVLLWLLTSCGGGSNGGSSPPGSTPQGTPITFTITVIGAPASISQPSGAAVTLIVN